jgi:hypothetical protein
MKKLLYCAEDLEGKTIESVEIDSGYSSGIVIKTTTGEVLVMSAGASWDRCGDYEGCNIEISGESDLSYHEKEIHELLTEKDIELHKIEEEKRKQERIKKEAEEKKKAQDAQDKMRKSELELLAKLKQKYEN